MSLNRFRALTYKNIIDSGWVDLDRPVTCFIGQNQSGKTNTLKCLHSVNPFSSMDDYNYRHHWPKNIPSSCDESYFACALEVELLTECPISEDDQHEYNEDRNGSDDDDAHIKINTEISKHFVIKDYGNNYYLIPTRDSVFNFETLPDNYFDFVPEFIDAESATRARVAHLHESIGRAFGEGRVVDVYVLFIQLRSVIVRYFRSDRVRQESRQANEYVLEMGQSFFQYVEKYSKDIDEIKKIVPMFIYMDQYKEFSGEIYYSVMSSKKPIEEYRTNEMMLALGGIETTKYLRLAEEYSNSDDKDRRWVDEEIADSLRRASDIFSGKLMERWTKDNIAVEIVNDQMNIRFNIIDNKEKQSVVALSEQSSGFRWFFSFVMRFLYESENSFANCVVLLDEPGLHLHPSGQRSLLKEIFEYADSNKIIYTTHLPFMVDMSDPLSVKSVVSPEKNEVDHVVTGSVVKKELWDTSKEAKSVIEASLGIQVAQFLSIRESNLVVEGVSDFILINELSRLANRLGRPALSEEVAIVPAGSADKIPTMATYMLSQKLKVVCLFDDDNQGRQASKKQKASMENFGDDAFKNNIRIMHLSIAAKSKLNHMEAEDVFVRSYYLNKVASLYTEKSVQQIDASILNDSASNVQAAVKLVGSEYSKKDIIIEIARDIRGLRDEKEYLDFEPNFVIDPFVLVAKIDEAFKSIDETYTWSE